MKNMDKNTRNENLKMPISYFLYNNIRKVFFSKVQDSIDMKGQNNVFNDLILPVEDHQIRSRVLNNIKNQFIFNTRNK